MCSPEINAEKYFEEFKNDTRKTIMPIYDEYIKDLDFDTFIDVIDKYIFYNKNREYIIDKITTGELINRTRNDIIFYIIQAKEFQMLDFEKWVCENGNTNDVLKEGIYKYEKIIKECMNLIPEYSFEIQTTMLTYYKSDLHFSNEEYTKENGVYKLTNGNVYVLSSRYDFLKDKDLY